MAVAKRWHIAFSTTESSRPINISMPKKVGLFLCALSVVFLLFFAGSILFIILNQSQIAQAKEITEKNIILKDKIGKIRFVPIKILKPSIKKYVKWA